MKNTPKTNIYDTRYDTGVKKYLRTLSVLGVCIFFDFKGCETADCYLSVRFFCKTLLTKSVISGIIQEIKFMRL